MTMPALNKADRLLFGESLMTHAMAITGVSIEVCRPLPFMIDMVMTMVVIVIIRVIMVIISVLIISVVMMMVLML
jgi:hypothetical protein